jgi:two-component system cell cycle sensor histidine kinase/response regulator CckA
MKKILVVDNDQFVLDFIDDFLTKEGHQVVTAKDSLIALDILQTYVPEVMFVDLVMPNIDGRKLCQVIQEIPDLKETDIIILSAIAAEEEIDIDEIGADGCIAKGPFEQMMKNILDVISKSDPTYSKCLSGKMIGTDSIFPRAITRELLSVKRHFDILLEKMSEGILEITPEGRIVYANHSGISMINLPENRLLGSNFVDLFRGGDRKRIENLLKKTPNISSIITEKSTVSLDGHRITLSLLPLKDDDSRSIVILNDVTKQKLSEDTLREINKFLRSILDSSSNIAIISTDPDNNILFWNKGAENMLGYRAEEVVGLQPIEILYPGDEEKQKVTEMRSKVLKEKLPVNFEIQEVTKDGRKIWVNLNLAPRFDDHGNAVGILGIGEDISERKSLANQLHQAQRMKSIGTLAGGLAHDFNNLLMGIQGNASLIILDTDPQSPHYEKLKNIEQYVRSGTEVTRQLLGFARGGKYEVKPTDLNRLIKKSLEIFGRTKKEITIKSKLQKNLWAGEVDRGQIDQVLLNIYVNASQAMPGGGKMYVETKHTTIEDINAKLLAIEPGRYIIISITDSGIGMDSATQQRIFDPFFTTGQMGRGTGLGLASAYGIVRNHGGIITVDSIKGEGTTLNVYLPASKKKVTEEKVKDEKVLKGTETVLLVDDEEMIIDVGRLMLKEMGYRVLIAKNGQEALSVYHKNKDQVDIVILDIIMPDMGGGITYDQLKEINPHIKVLLSSGYSIDGEASVILDRGCNGFIQKPFSIKQLSQEIRKVLDKEEPRKEC